MLTVYMLFGPVSVSLSVRHKSGVLSKRLHEGYRISCRQRRTI